MANTNEVGSLIALANQNSNVLFVVVGSEAILRQENGWGYGLPEADVIAHVNRARQNVAVPVTVAEPWHIWTNHPALVEAVDLIFINEHPYWEGQPIGSALNHVVTKYREIHDLYPHKPIVISETGWPSGGLANGPAQPSLSNQVAFAREFLAWAGQEGVDFFWFEAFDEAWKTNEPNGVGPTWGIYLADRTAKTRPRQTHCHRPLRLAEHLKIRKF